MTEAPKNTLYHALLNAQKKIQAVVKDANNDFFKSTYTTLSATIDACKTILNDEGILVIQEPTIGTYTTEDRDTYTMTILRTRLVFVETGEEFKSDYPIPTKEGTNPQVQGSAITYAKRYALQAILFMATEDDDGNSAAQNKVADKPVMPTNLSHHCDLHNAEMKPRFSETKNKWFTYHMIGTDYCFGSGTKKEQEGGGYHA